MSARFHFSWKVYVDPSTKERFVAIAAMGSVTAMQPGAAELVDVLCSNARTFRSVRMRISEYNALPRTTLIEVLDEDRHPPAVDGGTQKGGAQ